MRVMGRLHPGNVQLPRPVDANKTNAVRTTRYVVGRSSALGCWER